MEEFHRAYHYEKNVFTFMTCSRDHSVFKFVCTLKKKTHSQISETFISQTEKYNHKNQQIFVKLI